MKIKNLKLILRTFVHWTSSLIGGAIIISVIALAVAVGVLLVGVDYHFLGTLAAIIASVVVLAWMFVGFDAPNKDKSVSVCDMNTWIKNEINEKKLNISGFPKDIAEKTIASHIRSAEERGEIETRIDSKLMLRKEIETALRDRIEKEPAIFK